MHPHRDEGIAASLTALDEVHEARERSGGWRACSSAASRLITRVCFGVSLACGPTPARGGGSLRPGQDAGGGAVVGFGELGQLSPHRHLRFR